MSTNQKGAVHLLIPVIILAVVSLVTLSKVQTTTTFDDSGVAGISAKSQNKSANGNKPTVVTNKGVSSDEKGKGAPQAATTNKIEKQEDKAKKIEIKDVGDAETEEEVEDAEDETEEGTPSASPPDTKEVQQLRSISKFPLRIDVTTNQLIMTKNGVERVLTVLPAKAVQNMLRAHLKKGLGPKFFQATASATPIGTPSASASPPSATPSGSPSATSSATPSATPTEEPIATESATITILEDQISLEEDNGQVVYKIPAKKKLKIFGLIPVTTDLTGFVSAQTGVLIKENESLLSRILSLLSF